MHITSHYICFFSNYLTNNKNNKAELAGFQVYLKQ